ncbi:hypothetical protein AQUCO_03900113v1 [Aquilegia coerulea]|uniref:Uncharacterized protein n=1 Tax=Aquilegia coerulea TaxID=218851 RepID=A0A2G5CRR9_AQUCA|nr:hypothetical protein AQUCO_03900113v1 [Aquilegia coerulea]
MSSENRRGRDWKLWWKGKREQKTWSCSQLIILDYYVPVSRKMNKGMDKKRPSLHFACLFFFCSLFFFTYPRLEDILRR